MEGDRWLTVAQVAELLQVHPETVRLWLRTGRLPGTRLSRRAGWRVSRTAINRLLSSARPFASANATRDSKLPEDDGGAS